MLEPPPPIPTIAPPAVDVESVWIVFRLAVLVMLPPLKMLPRMIPFTPPPAAELKLLIVFDVIVWLTVTPTLGAAREIPVKAPLARLTVLIVFDVIEEV